MAWMSLQETAGYLGVSKETMYRLLYRGDIASYRVGKLYKFDSKEIDSWVRSKNKKSKKVKKVR